MISQSVVKILLTEKENRTFADYANPLLPNDKRLEDVRHVYTRFEFPHFDSLQEWEERKSELKQKILVSAGLWPMPEKCPLHAKIFGRAQVEDVVIDKFMFESYPGFYVTGNLFRPAEIKGRIPAVLNAHGHWEEGRIVSCVDSDIPLRCINFAKMGFIALSYDMLGFNDSRQVSHRYSSLPQEMWSVSALGLQLWNSIRCIDFLETLPETDPLRIGCTGASGGGTQTFMLAAVDERIQASAPVNMVSATMQGGCTCENAPLLRVDTFNLEIAAMAAPRAQMLVGATGDWTDLLPTVDYPAIKEIYTLYGKPDMLEYFYQDANHNYNAAARAQVYNFFARRFLGQESSWTECAVNYGDGQNHLIYKADEKPEGFVGNQAMFALQKEIRKEAVAQYWKNNGSADTMLAALRHITGVREGTIALMEERTASQDGATVIDALIGSKQSGQCIPLWQVQSGNKKVMLVLHPNGKRAALETFIGNGSLETYISEGYDIASPDLFLTGSYHRPYGNSGRKIAGSDYFTCYNYSDAACRVQDVAACCRYLRSRGYKQITILALGEAGYPALAALPFCGPITDFIYDALDIVNEDENWFLKHFFLPGFLSIGGFDTCRRLAQKNEIKYCPRP